MSRILVRVAYALCTCTIKLNDGIRWTCPNRMYFSMQLFSLSLSLCLYLLLSPRCTCSEREGNLEGNFRKKQINLLLHSELTLTNVTNALQIILCA